MMVFYYCHHLFTHLYVLKEHSLEGSSCRLIAAKTTKPHAKPRGAPNPGSFLLPFFFFRRHFVFLAFASCLLSSWRLYKHFQKFSISQSDPLVSLKMDLVGLNKLCV